MKPIPVIGFYILFQMKKLKKVPVDVSVHMQYLHQDLKLKGKALLKRFPNYSKSSIYRHAKKPIGTPAIDKRRNNPGRPSKLSERDKRAILRQVEVLRGTVGYFTSRRLRISAGIGNRTSDECVRRVLRKSGLRYGHCRKKGLLTKKDLRLRMAFARKVKRVLNPDFWKSGISFYLDGASFVHKYNPFDQAKAPKTMAWRRPGEGLKLNCTAKGSHEGTGGRVAHFMAAIAHGKGVVLCEQYHGKLNGQSFAEFIREHFPRVFKNSANPKGKLFLQDGDPSQNSKKARDAMDSIGAKKFSIPPRSPDLNPIENIFHQVKGKLYDDALERNIQKERFKNFSERVKQTIEGLSVQSIDKTISSMDKRIGLVIKARGQRIKY